jgi:hypothetical protein
MLLAGKRLGPYEIETSLGAGGMGEVYLARDTRLGRKVAVKVLPDAVSSDRERRDRFDREARAVAADALATEAWAEKVWSDSQYTHLMAQAQAILGRRDQALRWLRRATERGLIHYPFLAERDPLLANLRGDHRFAELLESVRARWERFERDVDTT